MEAVANGFLGQEDTKSDFLLEVLNVLPIGIVFLSDSAEIIGCNQTFQDLFSMDSKHYSQILRKNSGKIIDPDFKSLVQRIKAENMVSTNARWMYSGGKKEFPVRVFGKEIFYAVEPTYILALSDISEKAEAENFLFSEIQEMEMQYSLMNVSLNRIASNLQNETRRIEKLFGLGNKCKKIVGQDNPECREGSEWTDRCIRSVLSKREYEVLLFLRKGYKLKDIGREIGLDIRTVGTYKVRALKKLNIHTNSEFDRLMQVVGPA